MTGSHGIGSGSARILSPLIVILGVAIIIRTVAAGGGALSIGVLLGAMFVLIGAGRLYLARRAAT